MPDSLRVDVYNADTTGAQIYAYVTGLALQHDSQRCLLKANGQDLYFPENPSEPGAALAEDCAIPLGGQGSTTTLTIPQIAGGRVWFSRNAKLTFVLNPGPSLVEPSVLNSGDPNADVDFAFCEFTLNNDQFYGNISYVDFVPRLPVGISLDTSSGNSEVVTGLPADGLERIAAGLRDQTQRDQRGWDKLIVNSKSDGKPLRVLNPTHGDTVSAGFDGYYEPYVDQVWSKYESAEIQLNTQAAAGVVSGRVENGSFNIGGESFAKPNTNDILGCNSGPFATGSSATRNAIIPRLAAAFVRSTLLTQTDQPSAPDTYYQGDVVNHYCRIVHEQNNDRKGYAFAYDDVQPDGGIDQSGKVNAGDPTVWKISVGGAQ